MSEIDRVRERYERRADKEAEWDYLSPYVIYATQEKERMIARWITTCGLKPVRDKRVLDVGCGPGSDLLDLLRLGFEPARLCGWELLEQRAEIARRRLPAAARIEVGDALEIPAERESFDIVAQHVVFTSLLDEEFQRRLADRMWDLVVPGGGILWFDFVYDNPRNADVRGIPTRRIAELFPYGEMTCWKLHLAPPIARAVTRLRPWLYPVFNSVPALRSHVLSWIRKP